MTITDLLLDTARSDTDLLIKNDSIGDQFAVPRKVDFLLIADSAETAETVCSFIVDNQYAECRVDQNEDGKHWVLAEIEMPITQNVICAVSGLFACISKIFNVEYDGWGSVICPEKEGAE